MIGLIITAGLVMAKVRGGLLWGLLVTSFIGLFIKDPTTGEAITKFNGVMSAPDSVAPIFCKFEWDQVLSLDMLVVIFTFLFLDLFDTMGTIIGVHQSTALNSNKDKKYVACHAVAGKFKDISITMWILAVLFICKYIFI